MDGASTTQSQHNSQDQLLQFQNQALISSLEEVGFKQNVSPVPKVHTSMPDSCTGLREYVASGDAATATYPVGADLQQKLSNPSGFQPQTKDFSQQVLEPLLPQDAQKSTRCQNHHFEEIRNVNVEILNSLKQGYGFPPNFNSPGNQFQRQQMGGRRFNSGGTADGSFSRDNSQLAPQAPKESQQLLTPELQKPQMKFLRAITLSTNKKEIQKTSSRSAPRLVGTMTPHATKKVVLVFNSPSLFERYNKLVLQQNLGKKSNLGQLQATQVPAEAPSNELVQQINAHYAQPKRALSRKVNTQGFPRNIPREQRKFGRLRLPKKPCLGEIEPNSAKNLGTPVGQDGSLEQLQPIDLASVLRNDHRLKSQVDQLIKASLQQTASENLGSSTFQNHGGAGESQPDIQEHTEFHDPICETTRLQEQPSTSMTRRLKPQVLLAELQADEQSLEPMRSGSLPNEHNCDLGELNFSGPMHSMGVITAQRPSDCVPGAQGSTQEAGGTQDLILTPTGQSIGGQKKFSIRQMQRLNLQTSPAVRGSGLEPDAGENEGPGLVQGRVITQLHQNFQRSGGRFSNNSLGANSLGTKSPQPCFHGTADGLRQIPDSELPNQGAIYMQHTQRCPETYNLVTSGEGGHLPHQHAPINAMITSEVLRSCRASLNSHTPSQRMRPTLRSNVASCAACTSARLKSGQNQSQAAEIQSGIPQTENCNDGYKKGLFGRKGTNKESSKKSHIEINRQAQKVEITVSTPQPRQGRQDQDKLQPGEQILIGQNQEFQFQSSSRDRDMTEETLEDLQLQQQAQDFTQRDEITGQTHGAFVFQAQEDSVLKTAAEDGSVEGLGSATGSMIKNETDEPSESQGGMHSAGPRGGFSQQQHHYATTAQELIKVSTHDSQHNESYSSGEPADLDWEYVNQLTEHCNQINLVLRNANFRANAGPGAACFINEEQLQKLASKGQRIIYKTLDGTSQVISPKQRAEKRSRRHSQDQLSSLALHGTHLTALSSAERVQNQPYVVAVYSAGSGISQSSKSKVATVQETFRVAEVNSDLLVVRTPSKNSPPPLHQEVNSPLLLKDQTQQQMAPPPQKQNCKNSVTTNYMRIRSADKNDCIEPNDSPPVCFTQSLVGEACLRAAPDKKSITDEETNPSVQQLVGGARALASGAGEDTEIFYISGRDQINVALQLQEPKFTAKRLTPRAHHLANLKSRPVQQSYEKPPDVAISKNGPKQQPGYQAQCIKVQVVGDTWRTASNFNKLYYQRDLSNPNINRRDSQCTGAQQPPVRHLSSLRGETWQRGDNESPNDSPPLSLLQQTNSSAAGGHGIQGTGSTKSTAKRQLVKTLSGPCTVLGVDTARFHEIHTNALHKRNLLTGYQRREGVSRTARGSLFDQVSSKMSQVFNPFFKLGLTTQKQEKFAKVDPAHNTSPQKSSAKWLYSKRCDEKSVVARHYTNSQTIKVLKRETETQHLVAPVPMDGNRTLGGGFHLGGKQAPPRTANYATRRRNLQLLTEVNTVTQQVQNAGLERRDGAASNTMQNHLRANKWPSQHRMLPGNYASAESVAQLGSTMVLASPRSGAVQLRTNLVQTHRHNKEMIRRTIEMRQRPARIVKNTVLSGNGDII